MKKSVNQLRLFLDMDGTLAVFDPNATTDMLMAPGYFAALKPLPNMLETVRLLLESGECEVFALSSCLVGTNAITEKNQWLDTLLPGIDADHRIYPICGTNKSAYIPGGVKSTDVLLDDFSINLHDWVRAGGTGIKLLNGINGHHGSWKGAAVSNRQDPDAIAGTISSIIQKVKQSCA